MSYSCCQALSVGLKRFFLKVIMIGVVVVKNTMVLDMPSVCTRV